MKLEHNPGKEMFIDFAGKNQMLELRFEQESWEKENVNSFNFYDEVHKFPRINLKIREEKNCLIIDLKPF